MSETYRRCGEPAANSNPPLTLNLPEFRAELRVQVRAALRAPPNTVTVCQPMPGMGKTWITAEEVAALPDGMKVAIFAQTHALARAEWNTPTRPPSTWASG